MCYIKRELNHKGTQSIFTERLILRRCTTEDAEDIFTHYATDNEVTKFLSFAPHKNIEETREVVSRWLESYSDLNFYHWVLEYEGRVIGSISAVKFDELNCAYELGYCIGRNYWNKGIMTEAVSAVIDYLFREVNMHRITAKHDVKNPNSGKVMKKVGMRYEGTYKSHYLRRNGDISDSMVYAILKEEWENRPHLVL